MTSLRHNMGAVTTIAFAIACGALAILWPHWRAELGAASYYGYDTPIDVANPRTLAPGRVGQFYNEDLGIARGPVTDPVTVVSGTGTKPPGLDFGSPVLTGTPTQAGTFVFTVNVIDTVGPIHGRVKITICPQDVTTLIICDTALLEAETKLAHDNRDFITAAGGSQPFSFSLLPKNSLPTGLQLSPVGAITGTPKPTAKTKNFTAQVTDGQSQTANKQLNLTVVKALGLSGSLKRGRVGVSYSASLKATGGLAPIVWKATGLPSGLFINSSTGEIGGVPQAVGKSPVSIEATDALNGKASKNVNLVVGK